MKTQGFFILFTGRVAHELACWLRNLPLFFVLGISQEEAKRNLGH
jgi:hypothetical protein